MGPGEAPGAGLTSSPPGRYLYNHMGYWSDWSVPILVTTAAAFTYIAGLLVRGAVPEGGRPCSEGEGEPPWSKRGKLAFPRAAQPPAPLRLGLL